MKHRKRIYKVRNVAMLEAFAEAVHDAPNNKLRHVVKETALRRIKQLKL